MSSCPTLFDGALTHRAPQARLADREVGGDLRDRPVAPAGQPHSTVPDAETETETETEHHGGAGVWR
jgi:hypothetical protein